MLVASLSSTQQQQRQQHEQTRQQRQQEQGEHEQQPVSCNPYGPGVDVWALGCLMALLLTGRVLMPGSDCVHQLRLIDRLAGPLTPAQVSGFRVMVLGSC